MQNSNLLPKWRLNVKSVVCRTLWKAGVLLPFLALIVCVPSRPMQASRSGFATGSAPAAAQQAIACGQTLSGNITAVGQQVTYTFNANAGEAVNIAAVATSGDLAARAELFSPSNTLIGANGFGNTNTGKVALPATGTYTILVKDFDLNKTGAFALNLQFTTGRCGTSISCGQTLNGNIASSAQQDTYTFSANAGEAVNIAAIATSDPLAARLELYGPGPSNTLIGANGFGNTNTGSLTLPATGTYTILVRDFNLNRTGAYAINLQFTTGRCGTAIACGETKTGRNIASIAQQDTYTFSANAGEAVNIAAVATSGELAARLELYSPSNTLIGANGFGNTNTGSLRLPASGVYTILVRDFNLNRTGAYAINLQFTTGRCGTPISGGQTLSGSINSAAEQDSFVFCGREGGSVNISAVAASGMLAARAEVYNPSGTLIGANGFGNASTGNLTLSVAGVYTILIRDFNLNQTGNYNVNLTCLGNACAPPVTLSLTPNQLTITAGASGNMTVTISAAQSTATTVTLSSTNPGSAKVDASVMILANATSATFPVMGVAAGSATITASLGCVSATSSVTVNNPAPTLSSLAPSSAIAGGPTFTLTVNGANFVSDSKARWNGSERTTSFVSATQLTAAITAADISTPGTASVTVSSPTPGGGVSNVLSFTINQPMPNARIVRVVNASGNPGGPVSIPIELVSLGDENALGFSLTFNTTLLSNPQAALGSDANGATLNTNLSQVGQGRFGIALSLPAGQVFTAGARHIVTVTFTVAAGATAGSTPIGFTDQPIAREVVGVNANPLPATFSPGTVTIFTGLEGDVAPRDNPNGAVTISDWVQVGRFAAGLDTASLGSEFQRADCAPRSALGNGSVTISDWVQAGRYAAGLDPPTPAGGPTSPTSASVTIASANATAAAEQPLHAVKLGFEPGPTGSVTVGLDAQGDEQALGFSLRFDPTQVRFISAQAGRDAAGATLYLNASEAASGRIGIAITLPIGQTFAAGAQQAVTVTFATVYDSSGASAIIEFGDHPIAREIADADARALPVSWASSPVAIHARAVTSISAASFRGSPLAVESIVAAFGPLLATATEAAMTMPLPTALSGTRVVIRDSAGAEHLAPLMYISPSQVNYQIPPGTASGEAVVTIISGNGADSIGSEQIAAVAPGVFTANADGQGVAAAVAVRVKADGTQSFEPVARFDPAQNRFVAAPIYLGPETDQVFLIPFGTGFRFRSSLSVITVKIGGADMEVLYAGEAPGFIGLDQLNVRLSRSLIGRGEVDVALTVDGRTANIVRVNIK